MEHMLNFLNLIAAPFATILSLAFRLYFKVEAKSEQVHSGPLQFVGSRTAAHFCWSKDTHEHPSCVIPIEPMMRAIGILISLSTLAAVSVVVGLEQPFQSLTNSSRRQAQPPGGGPPGGGGGGGGGTTVSGATTSSACPASVAACTVGVPARSVVTPRLMPLSSPIAG